MMAYPRLKKKDRVVLSHSQQMPSLADFVTLLASWCIIFKTALQVHGVNHVIDPFERCIYCRMDGAHENLQANGSYMMTLNFVVSLCLKLFWQDVKKRCGDIQIFGGETGCPCTFP